MRDFSASLPGASIYVYDNNSTDNTMERARQAGAIVGREPAQGKGNVVRRMFSDIDADVYVLVDGDDTYDAKAAFAMVTLLLEGQNDMVVGRRVSVAATAYRFGHEFGNLLFTRAIELLFGTGFTDILSGYRVFSRRFVKSFPCLTTGFEIESELTVHALSLSVPVGELSTEYRNRPEGSASKLATYRDGWRILLAILTLFRREKPMVFFSIVSGALFGMAAALMAPVVYTYFQIGLVPRFPTVIVATGLAILGSLSFACGLILDTVTQGRREMRRLAYLALKGNVAPPPR